jgi:putative transferase (TIGR04331 family)
MKYLATTGISEIWDLESEKLLLLGPWCMFGENNRKRSIDRALYMIPTPWKPPYKIKEAADYCENVYETVMPGLGRALNSVHGTEYPVRYWRILLGRWLINFISVFYDRYKRIEKALERFPDLYTHVLPKERCKPFTHDTYDFLGIKIEEHYYNLMLFSLIAYELCPENIEVINLERESRMNTRPVISSWRRKNFNKLMGLLSFFTDSPVVLCDMYHLVPSDMLSLVFEGGFKTFRFMHFEPMKSFLKDSYSQKVRNAVELSEAGDRFVSLLQRVIPEAVPICYMENYDIYKNNVKLIRKADSVKMVGSAIGWAFNEKFKFFAAESSPKPMRFAEFQHGGNYGMALSIPAEETSFGQDFFYTWGWRRDKEGLTKPLPNPHLSRLKDTHKSKHDNILFIGVIQPKYLYRFNTWIMPEDMTKYFKNKKTFLSSLPDNIRRKVLYAPYRYDSGWAENEFVKSAYPDIKLLLNEKATHWMQKVKLVVIDHPHTSFLEALVINVPCVLYWDHDVYLMRPEAEEYFEALRDAGILYKDPANAAQKTNGIFHDPRGWWSGKKVQNARLKFCERFARARKDWAKAWVKELKGSC